MTASWSLSSATWSENLTHWQRTPHRSVFPAAAAKVRWSSEEEVFGQNSPPQAVCKRAPWPSKWWVSSPGSKWLWHCCPSLTSPYVGLPEPAVLEESHHDFKGQHGGHSCSWCKKVDATIWNSQYIYIYIHMSTYGLKNGGWNPLAVGSWVRREKNCQEHEQVQLGLQTQDALSTADAELICLWKVGIWVKRSCRFWLTGLQQIPNPRMVC